MLSRIRLRDFIILLIFLSAILSYLWNSANIRRDIDVHSSSARLIELVRENGLESYFNINLTKPSSIYHIFYVLLFPTFSTFQIKFLFYFLYFILWIIAGYLLLKQHNKLTNLNLLLFFILSINTTLYFGMPSFLISQPLLLIFYSISLSFPLFIPIALTALFFIHPFSSFLYSLFMITYLSYNKEEHRIDLMDVIKYSFILLFPILTLTYLSFPDLFDSKSLSFSLDDFLKLKIASIFLLDPLTFYLISIPFISLLITFEKEKNHYEYLAIFLFLFILLNPEKIGIFYYISSRVIVFIAISLLLSRRFGEEPLLYALSAIFILTIILLTNPGIMDKIYSLFPQTMVPNNSIISHLLEKENIYPLFSLSMLLPIYNDSQIDDGAFSSNSFISKQHPISYKNIKTFFEYSSKFIFLEDIKTLEKDYCDYVKPRLEEVCRIHKYVISSEECQLNLKKETYYVFDNNRYVLYKC